MITSVVAVNAKSQELEMELGDISGGLVVQDIEGLDPVKAAIVTTSYAQMSGSNFASSRRESRDIKLKLGLEPDFVRTTVKSIRDQLYRFFMPESDVLLRFFEEGAYVGYISGKVEEFVNPRFNTEPVVDITVRCFDPDFIAPSSVVVGSTTVPGTAEFLIDNPGTVPSGLDFRMRIPRAVTEFTLNNRIPFGDVQAFEFDAPLQVGDFVEVSTQPGNKGVYLTRNGFRATYLYGMTNVSQWPTLMPGQNFLRVQTAGEAIPWEIEYTPRYGAL